jgi:hypothetical protein
MDNSDSVLTDYFGGSGPEAGVDLYESFHVEDDDVPLPPTPTALDAFGYARLIAQMNEHLQAFQPDDSVSSMDEVQSPVEHQAVVHASPSSTPSRKRKGIDVARAEKFVKRAVQELNRAESAEEVQCFLETVMRGIMTSMSPRVAAFFVSAATTPVVFPSAPEDHVSASPAVTSSPAPVIAVPPPPLEFADERAEVLERLYGAKTRKLDLLMRNCVNTFGDSWVSLAAIQQVALDVKFFRNASSSFQNVSALITARVHVDPLNSPKRAPKPLGCHFPYWEMRTVSQKGPEFRLTPPFFKWTRQSIVEDNCDN